MKFTNEQIYAVNARKKNILISAAAGSGKTSILVERIVKIITDDKNPVDINKLLAVTFTDAAAVQMKKRICQELYIKNPSENIKRQIILLNGTNICTIHSFCMSIIRKYFYLLNIDPNFKIAQENEMELMKSDILDEILEEEYENASKIFFETAVSYNTDKIQSDGLKKLILSIYNFSRSIPNSDSWLKNCADKFILDPSSKIEETIWWKKLLPYIKNYLEQINNLIYDSIQICNEPYGPEKYIDALKSDKIFADSLEKAITENFDSAYEILKNNSYTKLFSYTKKNSDKIDPILKETVQTNRKEIKKIIQLLQDKIFFSQSKFMLHNIKSSHLIINEIVLLVNKFHSRLKKQKLEQNILSFNDLEEFTLEILEYKKKLPEDKIKNEFEEVLIDEYQDINDVQEKILNLIPCKSKFMVGDVKQSIYGFRNSSPELFIQKYNTYENLVDAEKINLSTNFRSFPQITDSINFLFSEIMTKKFGGIDYSNEKLENAININGQTTELFVITNENDSQNKIENETQFICNKIKSIIEKPLCKNFSDIAILIRSHSNLNLITDIFAKNNIPVDIETQCDFFKLPEITILINFLKIIDNPLNEISIVSVLRSQIYNVNDNELLKIRAIYPEKNFYDCIKNYDGLENFKSDLNNMRHKKNHLPISKLIDEILEVTDFFYLCGLNQTGKSIQQNIIKFINIAHQYEKTNYKGLFNFIRYIEKIEEKNLSLNSYNKNSNAVKIMTMHKSKGLEFPVVFVSFLGRNFNMKNLLDEILLDKNLGFGNKFIDTNRRTKINTIARTTIEFELRKKNLEEEMRLLYVAMTRAKNKLILTASTEKYPTQNNFRCAENAKNFLDWIFPVAIKNNCPFKMKIIDKKIDGVEKNPAPDKFFTPVPIIKISEETKNKMEWEYPHNIFIHSKISINEIKNSGDENPEYIFTMPKFLQSKKLSPTEKGTAIHTVLHHLDFNLKPEQTAVKNFVHSLTIKNIITSQEEKLISINKLINFLSSDLAFKMKNSSFIKKETPFVLGIENENDSEKTLVHGIIDCFFEYNSKLFLIDYKTNKVFANQIENSVKKYCLQLEIYKKAIEKNFNCKVDFSIIYFFDINKVIYL